MSPTMCPLSNSKTLCSAGPKGGKRGTCPPEATTRHTLPPEKKSIFDLMTPKASCKKKMVPVRVAHSNPTYAITECKNGRALEKHGNILPLIRYQMTPHCDARDSKRQIEPWDERRNLAPFANCKDISSWQCD